MQLAKVSSWGIFATAFLLSVSPVDLDHVFPFTLQRYIHTLPTFRRLIVITSYFKELRPPAGDRLGIEPNCSRPEPYVRNLPSANKFAEVRFADPQYPGDLMGGQEVWRWVTVHISYLRASLECLNAPTVLRILWGVDSFRLNAS